MSRLVRVHVVGQRSSVRQLLPHSEVDDSPRFGPPCCWSQSGAKRRRLFLTCTVVTRQLSTRVSLVGSPRPTHWISSRTGPVCHKLAPLTVCGTFRNAFSASSEKLDVWKTGRSLLPTRPLQSHAMCYRGKARRTVLHVGGFDGNCPQQQHEASLRDVRAS